MPQPGSFPPACPSPLLPRLTPGSQRRPSARRRENGTHRLVYVSLQRSSLSRSPSDARLPICHVVLGSGLSLPGPLSLSLYLSHLLSLYPSLLLLPLPSLLPCTSTLNLLSLSLPSFSPTLLTYARWSRCTTLKLSSLPFLAFP